MTSLLSKNGFCQYCFSLRKYCLAHPFPCAMLLITTLIWLITVGFWAHSLTPPLVFHSTASLLPLSVRAGDPIKIHRTFTVLRRSDIEITRRLERGDCRQKCDRIFLQSTRETFNAGYDQTAEVVLYLPRTVPAGEWNYRAVFQWHDLFGSPRSADAPAMPLTVVEP